MHYFYLFASIICEVAGTSGLKATQEFTKFWPSATVVATYCLSFYLLTLSLRSIPVGVAYAIWAGIGVVLVAIVGVVFYKQALDIPAILGILLIVSGVVALNGFSATAVHPS